MSPEELAAYREWLRIMEFKDNAWPCMALIHIDQQATRIAELDDAVSGPLKNITNMLETVNADTIFSGIIQTWKNENDTLKTRITELEVQIAALKEIAISERSGCIRTESYDHIEGMYMIDLPDAIERAKLELIEEHPEAFK